jgi:hypothetical protein
MCGALSLLFQAPPATHFFFRASRSASGAKAQAYTIGPSTGPRPASSENHAEHERELTHISSIFFRTAAISHQFPADRAPKTTPAAPGPQVLPSQQPLRSILCISPAQRPQRPSSRAWRFQTQPAAQRAGLDSGGPLWAISHGFVYHSIPIKSIDSTGRGLTRAWASIGRHAGQERHCSGCS